MEGGRAVFCLFKDKKENVEIQYVKEAYKSRARLGRTGQNGVQHCSTENAEAHKYFQAGNKLLRGHIP